MTITNKIAKGGTPGKFFPNYSKRQIYHRLLCNHSGRGSRGNRQLLPCKSTATAGGFPGIPVRNGCKERGVSVTGNANGHQAGTNGATNETI